MTVRLRAAGAVMAAFLAAGASAEDAPPFEVAYRAWEIVTDVARRERQAPGACARTFQASAVPALRRQTRQEQDAAAWACVREARAVCADAARVRAAGLTRPCEDFR